MEALNARRSLTKWKLGVSSFSVQDLYDHFFFVPDGFRTKSRWVVSGEDFVELAKLNTPAGKPIMEPYNGGFRLFGQPVITED